MAELLQNSSDDVSQLRKKFTELYEESVRGFPISIAEHDRINQWKEEHNMKHQGKYRYIFERNAFDVSGKVQCYCGASYIFREK